MSKDRRMDKFTDIKMNAEQEVEAKSEMTLEEAKAYRASLYKEKPIVLTEQEKREQFRIFWTQNRTKYGETKELEEILWLHLKTMKLDDPEKFEAGIKHFGLKK